MKKNSNHATPRHATPPNLTLLPRSSCSSLYFFSCQYSSKLVLYPKFPTIEKSPSKSMADYRSKSFADANMQIQPYYGPPYKYTTTRPDDFRSYITSYASSSSYSYSAAAAAATSGLGEVAPQKLKKVKSTGGSTSISWSFKDPEFQRKKRVASYKVYAVEGKVKGSFRKSFRWLKDRYTQVVYGWW